MQLSHLDYARSCVEVDFEEVTDNEIRVDLGEGNVVQLPVIIPRMPQKCYKCGQFGHCRKSEPNCNVQFLKGLEDGNNLEDHNEVSSNDSGREEDEENQSKGLDLGKETSSEKHILGVLTGKPAVLRPYWQKRSP